MKKIIIGCALITTAVIPASWSWKQKPAVASPQERYDMLSKEATRLVNELEACKQENAQLRDELSNLKGESVAATLKDADRYNSSSSSLSEQDADALADILKEADMYDYEGAQ